MEIEEVRVYDAPNIYSLQDPIVRLQVKLGEGTNLVHVIEHLCLETLNILGYGMKSGNIRQVNNNGNYVIFTCSHPRLGEACGNFVMNTLNAIVTGRNVDIDSELSKLKKICVEDERDISTRVIISEAKKRGIPVSLIDGSKLIRLGYGKYQKLISPASDEGNSFFSAASILDMMFPEGIPFAIPIVSITGTNGKTTTTRMISSILRHEGITVGTTTSQGIYINDRCIEYGDTTGPKSARKILYNPEVEVAVLETARGGIVRKGLAYEKADVAVFTNLTMDHIGVDGINTMEELLFAKSLVIEAVKDTGVCVLNADDQWIMKVKEKAKGRQILFSIDDKNPILLEHMNKGGTGIYLRDDEFYITNKGVIMDFIGVGNIPATLNGKLVHNIYNSMAAIGACLALGISFNAIKEALSEFTCSASSNPGRFNIYDMGEFKVVLDFGHNIDGYRTTLKGLKALPSSRLVGIIRAPGDRLDPHILSIGEISGMSFDHILVREDKDLRGRQPLEVANLLYRGALSGGISDEHIAIIPDEGEALKKALEQAQNGDIITIFFEKMEPLMQIIEDYKIQISPFT